MARALLCGLVAIDLYQTATQPITLGEALAYRHLIQPPIREVLARQDAANQVLNTFLTKRSVGLVRLSEFSFRLPSLLSRALFLWVVYRISRRIFGHGPLLLAAVGLLSLNPLVLDEFSARGGFGMALAFWTCALERMMAYLQSAPAFRLRNLNLAGFLLGLSVAANLAFAFPAAGLAICFVIAAAIHGQLRWWDFMERFVLTSIVTAFVLLVVPLSAAGSGNLRGAGMVYFVPLALLMVVRVVGKPVDTPGADPVGQTPWSAADAPVGHPALLEVPALLRGGALLVAALLLTPYLYEIHEGSHRESPEQADVMKSLVHVLRQDAHGRHVRIGASPAVEPIIGFYRARYRLADWELPRQPSPAEVFDYYVLDLGDAGLLFERHLQVLYREGGLVLAR